MKFISGVVGLAAAATLVAACGPDPNETTAFVPLDPYSDVRQIEVRMTEFGFDFAETSVSPGEDVVFVVTNDGLVRHEFELTNDLAIKEHLESDHMGHNTDEPTDSDEDHVTEAASIMIDVNPGETKILEVTFPDDASTFTEFVCLVPGHYEAGMHSEIDYVD